MNFLVGSFLESGTVRAVSENRHPPYGLDFPSKCEPVASQGCLCFRNQMPLAVGEWVLRTLERNLRCTPRPQAATHWENWV
jgi:hypothetical protein